MKNERARKNMQIKFTKTMKVFLLFVLLTFVVSPSTLWAKGGYEITFLGVNLETFQGSDWMKVAAGAAASILTHELGHALYLESQGKDWRLEPSSSGFAVTTSNSLTDRQYRGLGRSGYLLQTGIGLLLTTFDATAKSDFTKGWVGVNVLQTLSYRWRGHHGFDDFAMIERGDGNGESSFRLFSAISIYNFLKANSETGSLIKGLRGFLDPKGPMTIQPSKRLYDERNTLFFSLDTRPFSEDPVDFFGKNRTEWVRNSAN
jgi:hypothetical protein